MKKLSIPEHITLDREYLPGIGKRELLRLMVSGAPGLLVAVIAWAVMTAPGPKLIAMVCGIGWFACCYAVVARIEQNQSIYSFLTRIVRFWRGQKKYYYKQESEVIRRVEEEKT